MNKKKKKILITGGNGFIAKNLFEQLKDDYEWVLIDIMELDLLDETKVRDYLKANYFDVIIHAATYDAAPAHSPNDPTKVFKNNLKMFFNLIKCKNCFGRLIYFGSGAEYSRAHWQPKMSENYFGQHVPEDQYGFSKYVMTEYALANDNVYNLRLFAVFGKYEDWRVRLVSSVCHSAALGKPIIINQNKYYDFLCIDDLVKIVQWFIENKPKKKIYNVCRGQVIDFQSIAEKVVKFSGKNLEIKIKNKGLGQEYSGDNSLLLNELKGLSFKPTDEAIKELYEWFKNK